MAASALAVASFAPQPVEAQERCRLLCAPELKLEPTITFENLWSPARVRSGGVTEETIGETVFEMILALDVPTQLPRLGLTLEASFAPFEKADAQPFTGETAQQAGHEDIRDNPVEIELELNFQLLEAEQTGGWLSSHFDVVDQFSPGELPGDASVYTHKLDFELDTALHVFNWLPAGRWLRNLELELSVDYLATGLPEAGDVIGGETFLDDASPWSLSLVMVMPLAPLVP